MKRGTVPANLAILSSLLSTAYGCSLINSYDEVVDSTEMSSQGGASSTGGGPSTGGGTMAMGGSSSMGGAPLGAADPGLVVVGGELDGDFSSPILSALSPQTGEELARLEGAYTAAAFEAEREIWFLIQEDELRPARFDRARKEWDFLGKKATVVTPADPGEVFAVTDSLAILDATGKLHVFDTSDLGAIESRGSVDYPHVGDAAATFWDGVAVANSVGGNVYVLWLDCPGDQNCTVRLTRYRIDDDGIQEIGAIPIQELDVTSTNSAGNLTYNPGSGLLVAVVPDLDGVDPLTSVVWTVSNQPAKQASFEMDQQGLQPRTSAVDPCRSVLFVKDTKMAPLVGAGLVDSAERVDLIKGIGLNGQGMLYEPYSRSVIFLQTTGDDFTIDAWEVLGTQLEPDLKKRIGDWQPPSISPNFVAAAVPQDPVCD